MTRGVVQQNIMTPVGLIPNKFSPGRWLRAIRDGKIDDDRYVPIPIPGVIPVCYSSHAISYSVCLRPIPGLMLLLLFVNNCMPSHIL